MKRILLSALALALLTAPAVANSTVPPPVVASMHPCPGCF